MFWLFFCAFLPFLFFLCFWAWVHLASPVSPNFFVRDPFCCYAQKFPLFPEAFGDTSPTVVSLPPPQSSCKHTLASYMMWMTGGLLLTSSVLLGKLYIFLKWESTWERLPLHPMSCTYIFLPLLSFYQCMGHLCFDFSVWVDGSLPPCPFPWCVAVLFNFWLHLAVCLCLSVAAYTCPRGALLAGGPSLAH